MEINKLSANHNELATLFKLLRVLGNETQTELAEALDISASAVASYEIGTRKVPLWVLNDLAMMRSMKLQVVIE